MSRKGKKKSKKKQAKGRKKGGSKPIKNKKNPIQVALFKQILSALFLVFIAYQVIDSSKSYSWILDLLAKNLETIEKYPDLTTKEKQQIKIPGEAAIMNFYRDNTPDTAVILMPPPDVVKSTEELRNLSSANLSNKAYASYFVLPRRLVYPKDIENNASLKDSITHVAIMNYKGYDNLSYSMSKKEKFYIAPIRPMAQ